MPGMLMSDRIRISDGSLISAARINASGADEKLRTGELHTPETHLIPNVFLAARNGTPVSVFGADYETPDGTCVRDYIHVSDLADAHLLALGACEPGRHRVYNLGNGAGFSVREVIDVCREVTGREIVAEEGPRRAGDPAILVASSERIQAELGWRATRDLRAMVADAWQCVLARAARLPRRLRPRHLGTILP